MLNFLNKREKCFCAFCKNPRSIYTRKHIDIVSLVLILVVGLSFGYLHSSSPGILEVVFMSTMVIFGEVLFQLRWRVSIICKYCGFDPIIYKRDPNLAASKVKVRLEERKEDADAILGPPIILPRQSMSSKKGVLISRQV